MVRRAAAEVGEQIRTVLARLEAVHAGSAQDLQEVITKPRAKGGRMRVDTGFLRASLMASTASMPRVNPASAPVEGRTYGEPDTEFVIAGLRIDQPLFLGFTASYAAPREALDGFVEIGVLEWPRIVQENEQRAKEAIPDR